MYARQGSALVPARGCPGHADLAARPRRLLGAYQTLADIGLMAVQSGPRRLWTEVEHVYDEWVAASCPKRHRIGLTVAPDGAHHVWIGAPHSAHVWPLASPGEPA